MGKPVKYIICLLQAALFAATAAAHGMELPSAFDVRDIDGHSYIGEIRDQGQCGSCWSFGVLAAAEGAWNRTCGLYDDQAIDLSEAFMVWSLSPLYDGMAGCDGGILSDPMDALLEYGVPLEADFPYTITAPGTDLHWDASRYTFLSWYSIPVNDIETTKRVLNSIGVVAAAIQAEDGFRAYTDGIYEDANRAPQYLDLSGDMNHAISLVGWDDNPGDGGMGTWILRNSWGPDWGEDGYMHVRYTAMRVNLLGEYVMLEPWDGQSATLENSDTLNAVPWNSGGTLNAHGVDLWGGPASHVTNTGRILAEAVAEDELATGRGVYLWGGPQGEVVNAGDIRGLASSQNNQAVAYAICFQGGQVENRGQLTAEAQSPSEMAQAFGLWASNGSNALEILNSGQIDARAEECENGFAYGVWADSRGLITAVNAGTISAEAGYKAAGIHFAGGPAWLQNSGTIVASADDTGVGVLLTGGPVLLQNSGTISGSQYSIWSWDTESSTESCNVSLVLETGSDLVGPVRLKGDTDQLVLTGSGSEDEIFEEVETLAMAGGDWSLSGDSSFDAIGVNQGRLGIDGIICGDTTVRASGILGGNGVLSGDIVNFGTIAPGHSVGHLTLDGHFTQAPGGILEIEVGDDTADRLTVTGAADLAGTLLVLPDGYTTDGSYTFLDANNIKGSFDTMQSAAVLNATLLSNTPESLSLDVTRNSYISLAAAHNLSLAETLDGVRPTAEDDFADLLDRLDLAVTANELNTSLAELTPRIHGLATTLALEDGQKQFDALRGRMERIDPPNPGQGSQEDTSIWAEIPRQYARYKSDGAYSGVRETLHGFMLGLERRADNGLRLGLAAAATDSHYESDGSGDEGQSTTLQGYLYGLWSDPQDSEGWRLGTAFGLGATDIEADRSIAFSGRQAHSNHDGLILGGTFEGGYDWTPGPWKLGLSLGLSWVQLREDGFRESGADSADLNVRFRNSDSFQSFLGLGVARPMEWARFVIEPALRMQWHHEFSREGATIESELAGGGSYFSTPGRDLAGDSLVIGTDLKVQLSETSFANLGYDCKWQNHHGATDHALHLQATMRF